MTQIDPKQIGLSSRDRIERISYNQLALVIDRKSRIVMADGKRILEKVRKIQKNEPGVTVTLQTKAPVCSKTRTFLAENNVTIELDSEGKR
jgi:hypothetical protein